MRDAPQLSQEELASITARMRELLGSASTEKSIAAKVRQLFAPVAYAPRGATIH